MVVALLAVLVAGLLRSHAEILRALHDLGAGTGDTSGPGPRLTVSPSSARSAVDVTGVSPDGDAVRIAIGETGHPTLLAFLTSGCTTCVDFWNAFASPSRAVVPGDPRIVVVTKGEEAESPARLRRFQTGDIPVVMSNAAWNDYDAAVAPFFVYVDGPSGRIVGEGAAATWDHLVGMMSQALADAGVEAERRPGRRGGRERAERIDADLRAAGIEPGHPSLYPEAISELRASDGPE